MKRENRRGRVCDHSPGASTFFFARNNEGAKTIFDKKNDGANVFLTKKNDGAETFLAEISSTTFLLLKAQRFFSRQKNSVCQAHVPIIFASSHACFSFFVLSEKINENRKKQGTPKTKFFSIYYFHPEISTREFLRRYGEISVETT